MSHQSIFFFLYDWDFLSVPVQLPQFTNNNRIWNVNIKLFRNISIHTRNQLIINNKYWFPIDLSIRKTNSIHICVSIQLILFSNSFYCFLSSEYTQIPTYTIHLIVFPYSVTKILRRTNIIWKVYPLLKMHYIFKSDRQISEYKFFA